MLHFNIRRVPFLISKVAQSSNAPNVDKFSGVIPVHQIEKRFSRSSGPGGQHANNNATKCEISDATWIPERLRDAVAERFANRTNSAGEIIIDSERTRERLLNQADCFDKLRATIYDVERHLEKRSTSEEDIKIITKKQERAAQIRLQNKRASSFARSSRSHVQEL